LKRKKEEIYRLITSIAFGNRSRSIAIVDGAELLISWKSLDKTWNSKLIKQNL
jgi:hypothetical protein